MKSDNVSRGINGSIDSTEAELLALAKAKAAPPNGSADALDPNPFGKGGGTPYVPPPSPPATVIGGAHAAELCALTDTGRTMMARLGSVRVSDLTALKLLITHPTERDVDDWLAIPGNAWFQGDHAVPFSDVKAAKAGLDPKKRISLSTVVAYAAAGHPWAQKAVETARSQNTYAAKMGVRKERPVSLTAGDLMDDGAPADVIGALPSADKLTRGASALLLKRWDADDNNQTTEQARDEAAARAAAAIDIPDRLDLATFVPPDVQWVVDGLIPTGASLGLFAERKAGKTTTVVELARALLSGEAFLGRFHTNLPDDARVAVLDSEMTATMLHDEYTRAGVPLDRLDVWALRGKSAVLDMRDAAHRARWRQRITPGSFIVVDCLYTILGAAGIDENSGQVADVIEGIKTLAVECDAAGWCLVHHLGKDAGKGARGHSSIEGSVDTVAWIMLDGPLAADTPRTFEALGRSDVNVPRAQVMRGEDRRLTISDATPQADRNRARAADNLAKTIRLIREHPGLSAAALGRLPKEARHGLSGHAISNAISDLGPDGTCEIVNLSGRGDRYEWHVATEPADLLAPSPVLPSGPEADSEAVLGLIRSHPGKSGKQLSTMAPELRGALSQRVVYPAIAALSAAGRIVNRGDEQMPQWHSAE